MHLSSIDKMLAFRKKYLSGKEDYELKILDLGSTDIGGSYRTIFDEEKWEYTGIDLLPGKNVDIVLSDPYNWLEIESSSLDVFISGQTFEHIEYFWQTMLEIARVLKPGGLCCIIAPSGGPEHRYPVDCWRFYPDGFKALARYARLEVLEVRTQWEAEGHSDGSDIWADTMLVARKKEVKQQNKAEKDYIYGRIGAIDNDSGDSLSKLVKHVKPGSTILELGSATGYLTKYLNEGLNCTVDCVELSSEMAKAAEKYCRNMVVADLDQIGLENYFNKESFDYIIIADVLEHLKEHEKTLKSCQNLLKKNGKLVLSIPNISHASIIGDLLNEKFEYRDSGLLDRTHLRFFTRESIKDLLKKCCYSIETIETVQKLPEDTEMEDSLMAFPTDLQKAILNRKDALTYQFIIVCHLNDEDRLIIKEDDVAVSPIDLRRGYIMSLNERILALDEALLYKEKIFHEQQDALEEALTCEQKISHELETELDLIKRSRVWRIAEFFRWLFYVKLLGYVPFLQKVILTISRDGFFVFIGKARHYFKRNKEIVLTEISKIDYDKWMKSGLTKRKIAAIKKDISQFSNKPKISIIMPVYNTDSKLLSIAVKSVTEQLYENWELCIVDDCSTDNKTVNYLKSIKHPSIKVKFFDENMGISIASNEAVKLAIGEYIAFMDHDDEITKDALYEVAKAINAKAPALIYSDEDKVDMYGRKKYPYLKPDWSPDLLRSQNYICHFTAIRKKLFDQVGGFRKQFDGAQDLDLFLRISEKTNSIHHIPKILYSWRLIDSSTSCNPNSKPDAQINGLKAVDEHLKRVFGKEAYVNECDDLFVFDARFPVRNEPLASIIIPTKDCLNYLKPCVNSIVAQSTYNNYEIIILDNNSEKPETAIWLKEITKKYSNIKVIDAHYPFNWAELNNHGIREANGNVFIFLNNDTEIISRDWIERLAEEALRDDVGAVGSLLLYKDGTIQHAGVVVGLGGWAAHVYNGIKPVHMSSPYISPLVKRNVLAVSGACLALSRKTIGKVGNFDENFVVCGSDVEICLRAHEKGLNNIYDPFVKLYHFESKTRDLLNIPACDFDMSKKCYKNYLEKGDPFFNKNFSLTETMPTLKECNVEQNDKSNNKQ
ncbi:MAG: glycosyltransferase [Bacteroidetes bacterium]|nr:glycosyltransferase [Bacteroidota bacterium]